MMYNVIGNNCVGAYWYSLNGYQFNNPFIWMLLPYDSLYHCLHKFNTINWNNFRITESTWYKNTYIITVDNTVHIHYIHYKLNPYATTIRVNRQGAAEESGWNGNVEYAKIWQYVVDKYKERTLRMCKNAVNPVFLIREEPLLNNNANYSLKDIAYSESEYKRIIITQNTSIARNDDMVKVIHIKSFQMPYDAVYNHLAEINEYVSK